MGDISLAVSFSIFAGMSYGPGALLEFRATNCFMMLLSPISRVLIEGDGDGPFVGIGRDLKWSLRAFALSWSVVFKSLFNFSTGMPRFSVLFCLMKDQNCFGFVVKLSPMLLM